MKTVLFFWNAVVPFNAMDLLLSYETDSSESSEPSSPDGLNNKQKDGIPCRDPTIKISTTSSDLGLHEESSIERDVQNREISFSALPVPAKGTPKFSGQKIRSRFKHKAPKMGLTRAIDYGDRDVDSLLHGEEDTWEKEIEEKFSSRSENDFVETDLPPPKRTKTLHKPQVNKIGKFETRVGQVLDHELNNAPGFDVLFSNDQYKYMDKSQRPSASYNEHSSKTSQADHSNMEDYAIYMKDENIYSHSNPSVDLDTPHFKEIHGADLRHGASAAQLNTRGIRTMFGSDYEAKLRNDAKKVGSITKLAKQRHQLTSLYAQAKEQELEYMEQKGISAKSKAETHRKYGW